MRGLSSDLSPNVSPGSMSFNLNFWPFVTRKGLPNLRAFSITFLVFIAAVQLRVDLRDGWIRQAWLIYWPLRGAD